MNAKERGESFKGGDRLNESLDGASEVRDNRFGRLMAMMDRWFVKLVLESGMVAYAVILALVSIMTVTSIFGFWVVVMWIVDLFR